MNHSPEPWKVELSDDWDDRYEIDHSGDGSVVGCDGLFLEDADRIVACVNALAGIPSDTILKMGPTIRQAHTFAAGYLPMGGPLTAEFIEEYLEMLTGYKCKVEFTSPNDTPLNSKEWPS